MVKRHRSTLHELMQAFKIKPSSLETLATTGGNPAKTHKRPFKMDIAKDKEASIKADKEGREIIKVYSDGSAQDGKVGAAAVLIHPGKETRKLHYHLGPTDHHTVFEAELVGLLMGIHLIKTEKKRTKYALGVDNQAAMTAVATPGNRSGHYLADAFLTAAFALWKTNGTANYSLTLRWTAGHVNIQGNELADQEAKTAAEGTTSNIKELPRILRKPLKHNKSAAKQAHKKKLKEAWRKAWSKSPRAKRFKPFDSTLPSPKFVKLISDPNISRQGASWLFQLRTGHFPLNEYLFRFKRAESSKCPACGHHSKTPQHFILDCPTYAHERWALIARKGREGKKYANIIGKPKNAITLINFIHATGRLKYTPPVRGGAEAGGRRGVAAME
jgi:ribonuclease HI